MTFGISLLLSSDTPRNGKVLASSMIMLYNKYTRTLLYPNIKIKPSHNRVINMKRIFNFKSIYVRVCRVNNYYQSERSPSNYANNIFYAFIRHILSICALTTLSIRVVSFFFHFSFSKKCYAPIKLKGTRELAACVLIAAKIYELPDNELREFNKLFNWRRWPGESFFFFPLAFGTSNAVENQFFFFTKL